MANSAVFLCGNLGVLSVILNLFVIFALFRNRRRVLKNVFYVIVLHCAILDVGRGSCLIVYGLPYFANSMYKSLISTATKVMLLKASTVALVFLRIFNLLTIFNLLVFTTNEFIVIRYPLHYRRYFRRRAVLLILVCCWIVSTVMGLGLLVPPSNPYDSYSDDSYHIDVATISMLLISGLCFTVLAVVVVCYTFILRTIRKFRDESTLGDESHKIHNRTQTHKPVNGQPSNGSQRSKRFRMEAVARHKYIYVIGTVLIVDLLFLIPYSGIQFVAFLHLNHIIDVTHRSSIVRWWLQVLIGVHSVCQPLCYFRMTEFRRLACCNPRRPWMKSKSFSQLNKSFGNTRSVMKDEEDGENFESPMKEPLLNGKAAIADRSPPPSRQWNRGESIKFRTYGNGQASRDVNKLETKSLKNEVGADASNDIETDSV